MTTDQRTRVRDYLVAQAEQYDWLDLWPRVMSARTELLELLRGVSDAQAAWQPAEDEWSIEQVMGHALVASRDCMRLIEVLARGEAAARELPPGSQPAADAVPSGIEALRRAFAEHSTEFAALPLRVADPANLEVTAPHAFFGELNCRGWFLFQRIHDMDHINQITATQQAPGYPASEG